MKILIPAVYFGNTFYYHLLKKNNDLLIEKWENYEKQTFRNRCVIYGANGPLDLIIPVEKGKGTRKLFKDARINNSGNWQKVHWRSIESAYRTSPYFEYYEHELIPFFEKKTEFLFDFNLELQKKITDLIEINYSPEFTSEYHKVDPEIKDYRAKFDPRISPDDEFNFPQYMQVFDLKHGFIPNMSIIDLLFACGPSAGSYL